MKIKIKQIKVIDLLNHKVKTYKTEELIKIYSIQKNIPEKIVKELLKRKKVNFFTFVLKTLFGKYELFDFQYKGLSDPGHPDYMIRTDKDTYIEYKSPGDRISASQVEWVFNNLTKESIIIFFFDEEKRVKKQGINKFYTKYKKAKEIKEKDRLWKDKNPFK